MNKLHICFLFWNLNLQSGCSWLFMNNNQKVRVCVCVCVCVCVFVCVCVCVAETASFYVTQTSPLILLGKYRCSFWESCETNKRYLWRDSSLRMLECAHCGIAVTSVFRGVHKEQISVIRTSNLLDDLCCRVILNILCGLLWLMRGDKQAAG